MATEIRMPQLGLTMTEGTIGSWLKMVGDTIKKGEPIVEVITDKLTSEIESETDGVLLAICAHEDEDIPVQGLLGIVGVEGEHVSIEDDSVNEEGKGKSESVKLEKEEVEPSTVKKVNGDRIKISPLAKKTASKMNVDYSEIIGSALGGRILQKDILNNITNKEIISTKEKVLPLVGERRVKLSGMGKVIAERMIKAHNEIPCVTQNVKLDVTELMEFRKKINEDGEWKYSVNDFVLKAVAKALASNKHIMVSLEGDEIVYHEHVNVGMAVALDDGLIVPVIMDADKMGIEELSKVAKDLAKRAREGKLEMDEYKGSTFTVSNIGMFHVESFTPIINQPDAAILGVCEIQDELALVEGQIVVRKKMRISMTYDHRLMNGTIAAKFEISIKKLLEKPINIIL